jgi:hypothetical protein
VAKHWDLVSQASSLREGLQMIREARETRCTGWLPFDDLGCVVRQHQAGQIDRSYRDG